MTAEPPSTMNWRPLASHLTHSYLWLGFRSWTWSVVAAAAAIVVRFLRCGGGGRTRTFPCPDGKEIFEMDQALAPIFNGCNKIHWGATATAAGAGEPRSTLAILGPRWRLWPPSTTLTASREFYSASLVSFTRLTAALAHLRVAANKSFHASSHSVTISRILLT